MGFTVTNGTKISTSIVAAQSAAMYRAYREAKEHKSIAEQIATLKAAEAEHAAAISTSSTVRNSPLIGLSYLAIGFMKPVLLATIFCAADAQFGISKTFQENADHICLNTGVTALCNSDLRALLKSDPKNVCAIVGDTPNKRTQPLHDLFALTDTIPEGKKAIAFLRTHQVPVCIAKTSTNTSYAETVHINAGPIDLGHHVYLIKSTWEAPLKSFNVTSLVHEAGHVAQDKNLELSNAQYWNDVGALSRTTEAETRVKEAMALIQLDQKRHIPIDDFRGVNLNDYAGKMDANGELPPSVKRELFHRFASALHTKTYLSFYDVNNASYIIRTNGRDSSSRPQPISNDVLARAGMGWNGEASYLTPSDLDQSMYPWSAQRSACEVFLEASAIKNASPEQATLSPDDPVVKKACSSRPPARLTADATNPRP